jgi:hypothetical protein
VGVASTRALSHQASYSQAVNNCRRKARRTWAEGSGIERPRCSPHVKA